MVESESSIQNANTTNTNMSIADSIANDDDDDDSIIPETQDVFSQESIASLSQNKLDVEHKAELEQSQSNLSVVSISSHEVTQIKAANGKNIVDESRGETDFQLQTSIIPGKSLINQNICYSLLFCLFMNKQEQSI